MNDGQSSNLSILIRTEDVWIKVTNRFTIMNE